MRVTYSIYKNNKPVNKFVNTACFMSLRHYDTRYDKISYEIKISKDFNEDTVKKYMNILSEIEPKAKFVGNVVTIPHMGKIRNLTFLTMCRYLDEKPYNNIVNIAIEITERYPDMDRFKVLVLASSSILYTLFGHNLVPGYVDKLVGKWHYQRSNKYRKIHDMYGIKNINEYTRQQDVKDLRSKAECYSSPLEFMLEYYGIK